MSAYYDEVNAVLAFAGSEATVTSILALGGEEALQQYTSSTQYQTFKTQYYNAKKSFQFVIDGGGTAIASGSKGFLYVPYACTIVGWTLLGDIVGNQTVDVKKCTYATFPTTTSIASATLPSFTGAQKAQSTTLVGWTTALSADDILEFNVTVAATCTRSTLTLIVTIP